MFHSGVRCLEMKININKLCLSIRLMHCGSSQGFLSGGDCTLTASNENDAQSDWRSFTSL